MNPKRIKVEIDNFIGIVTLNRPEKINAFDLEMFSSISKAIKQLRRNKKLRVIILLGEGRDFSSGLDINSVMTNMRAALKIFWKWWPWSANLAQYVSYGWRTIPIPVITVIHGRCWGAAMQVALGTDYRISTPDSQLSIMESKWGLIPDMAGSLGLREIMPLDQAMKLTMTAEVISGEVAKNLNLVSEIHAQPYERAMELAKVIVQKSPDAICGIKRLYHKAWHHNDHYLLFREWLYQIRILLNKNRSLAVKIQKGKVVQFLERMNW